MRLRSAPFIQTVNSTSYAVARVARLLSLRQQGTCRFTVSGFFCATRRKNRIHLNVKYRFAACAELAEAKAKRRRQRKSYKLGGLHQLDHNAMADGQCLLPDDIGDTKNWV
jgi:hypothetical protein